MFIFGLSMDYEVFLLARIKEEWDRRGDNDAAVLAGIAASGPVITVAAISIGIVFGGFALGSAGRGPADRRRDGDRGPARRDRRPRPAPARRDVAARALELVATDLDEWCSPAARRIVRTVRVASQAGFGSNWRGHGCPRSWRGRVGVIAVAVGGACGAFAGQAAAQGLPPQEPGVTLRTFQFATAPSEICTIKSGSTPNVDKLMPTINWTTAADFGAENNFLSHVHREPQRRDRGRVHVPAHERRRLASC